MNNVLVYQFYQGDHTKQVYVTLGVGAQYAFSRHVEGILDYSGIRNLKSAPEYVHLETTGNKWGITNALSLGVRYRFSLGKSKQQ